MNKIVLILFFLPVFNPLKSQDAGSPKFRTLKFTDAEKKEFNKSAVNWDSIKKAWAPSQSLAENNAADANTAPVILPSPNSASLLNLISDNVDLYTGKTTVNLPIYELKCGSLSLPITLQSNVNAHKVNDIGSAVGLGMNLNAGGVITRVMKNLPDEFTGTIGPAFNIPGWGFLQLKGGQGIDLSNFDNYSTQTKMDIIVRGNWNQKSSLPSVGWDVQPDEFYFNFGNYSGKFVFDQDGGINLIPQSNVKITPLFQVINGVNKITGFTVLTEDGIKYEFGNLPGSNYSLAPVEESKLTVNTSSIQYTYRAIAFDPNTGYYVIGGGIPLNIPVTNDYAYEREPYLIGAVPGYYGNLPGNPSEACCLSNFDQAQNNDNTEYFSYPSSWMLIKITSATGDLINFNYSPATNITYLADRSFSSSLPDLAEERLPLSWGGDVVFASPVQPVWDGFRGIYTLPSRQNFTITKSTIDLSTRKLVSINTSENTTVNFNHITPREDLLNDKRLDNIVIINSNNTTVKKISFNYDIINTSVAELPDEQFKFFYHKTRYWYQNSNYIGMHSNFAVSNIQYPFGEEIRGGTSSPWAVPAEYRKRMFLTSVREEANGAMMPAYGFNYNNTVKLPYRTSVDQDYFGFANSNPAKHPFIGLASTSYLSYTYRNPHSGPPTNTAPAYFPGMPNTPKPILFFNTLNSSNGWTNPLYGGVKNYNVATMQAGLLNKITYPTGGYKEFVFEFNGNPSAWNGLRVNQVKEYESPTSAPIIKNYTYGTFVNTDEPALNYSLYETTYSYNGTWYFLTDREFFSGSRVNAEAITRGSAGGYSFAEVAQPNNGRTRHEFFTALDFPDAGTTTFIVSDLIPVPVFPINYPYPFPPKTSYDWKRGMPKKMITYNNTGAPLQSEEYMYPPDIQFNGIKLIPNFSVTRYPVSILGTSLIWNQRLFGKNYHISTWNPPIKTISRIYDQNGINFSESAREIDYRKYNFNTKDYLLPFQEKDLRNSHNEQTISYSKYPFDYNAANISDPFLAGIANLKAKHVIAKVEQFTYKQDQNGNNKKYIAGLLNKFHSDKTLTSEVFKLRTNGLLNAFVESNTNNGSFNFDPHYNSVLNLPLYDAAGRILEQQKTNDIKESYIWDYNKTYPVAKVINANSNEVAFSGFEADEAGANMSINPADIVNDPAGAFTGKKYYSLRYPGAWFPQEPITINLPGSGKEYKLTFWHKEPVLNHPPLIVHYYNGNVEPVTPFVTEIKSRNGWKYSEYIVPASFTGTLTIIKGYSSPPTYIDEVRFYPVQSQINTYTFDPLIGMTSETDVNGKTTYYEYDALNRLAFVKNEDKDIVKAICYNYANLVVPCATNIIACPAPVINWVVRTGGFDITLDFTAPLNSTNCTITVHDITDDIYWQIPPGCNSPRAFSITNKFHQYRVMVKSFSSACPLGVESSWASF